MCSKLHTLLVRFFRYSAYVANPGEVDAKFSSAEEMNDCATTYFQKLSWADTLKCVNKLKLKAIEDLDMKHAAARSSSAAQSGA